MATGFTPEQHRQLAQDLWGISLFLRKLQNKMVNQYPHLEGHQARAARAISAVESLKSALDLQAQRSAIIKRTDEDED